MEFKKSVLEKDAELKEIQNKLHRVETLKIESNSKVAGLEKYKKELEIEKNRFEKISLEKLTYSPLSTVIYVRHYRIYYLQLGFWIKRLVLTKCPS